MKAGKFTYRDYKTKEISFPLGGLGSGSIGLAGNGRLIDWEIANRPNKGSVNGLSHFAIKAEHKNKLIDARILNGDLLPPYTGSFARQNLRGYGFGPNRAFLTGLPHFKNSLFTGTYPIANIDFSDDSFPGTIRMTAYNPLIPLNPDDSSIPGAFFRFDIKNDQDKDIDYSLCMSLANPFDKESYSAKFDSSMNVNRIFITTSKYPGTHPFYGDISVATDCNTVSYQEYWIRGKWFDNLETFWNDFAKPGKLKNRAYNEPNHLGDVYLGADQCSLCAHIPVRANETKSVTFVVTWNVPVNYNYLNPENSKGDLTAIQLMSLGTDVASMISKYDGEQKTWRNYYSKLWKNSSESAVYSIANLKRLYEETVVFRDSLFNSSLPDYVIDAVSSNISILRSPTCWRLENGEFYGWEGCNVINGSCEGSCSHVWNYAYALPYLFPTLERSMRDLEFKYNLGEDGGLTFRLMLPLGRDRWTFFPCVDGQYGVIMKVYREWKMSGDTEWLKGIWEGVKKAVAYAWHPGNSQKWDMNKDGVIEGSQHHTLDVELYGPNSWLNGFYLGALKAAAEMADYLGDTEAAKEFTRLFNKGKTYTNKQLYNGEYFIQKINLKDKKIIEPFKDEKTSKGDPVLVFYWNSEHNELKYQIGNGCLADQVLAQWHANLAGLGEIFENDKFKSALKSIFKYNYKRSMREVFNPCRVYALNDEAAVIVCEWPENTKRPVVPVVYAEEAFNGVEYAVACQLIQADLLKEGLEIVKAVRERYNGENRNPWSEIECGSNYARSMSSYSLLPALSGFTFDMVNKSIGFSPKLIKDGAFKCFWSVASAWGTFEMKQGKAVLQVKYGTLELNHFFFDEKVKSVKVGGKDIAFRQNNGNISFQNICKVERDQSIKFVTGGGQKSS